MAEDGSRGVMLRLHVTLQDGEQVAGDWKAHAPLAPGTDPHFLKWELRRVLPTAGFEETRKQKMWHIIGDNWGKWVVLVMASKFDEGQHMGRSRHALLRRGGADHEGLADAEQDSYSPDSENDPTERFGNAMFCRCFKHGGEVNV